MDDFRDDGTRVCPVHGLRFDPELSAGCIKCAPGPSQRPKKKSTMPPKGLPLSSPPDAMPPSFRDPRPPSYAPTGRRSSVVPPMPLEPFSPSPGFGAGQFGMSGTNAAGPKITIIEGPQRKVSRRGLIRNVLLLTVAGGGAAAWFLRPEGPTDYSTKVQEFRYGPAGARKGAIFVPSTAGDEPRPLLMLIDPTAHPQRGVLRFARECEHFGWIVIASDALGTAIAGSDGAEAAMLLEDARSRAKIDGARPFLAGFDVAGEVACRLALMQPDVFAGAILECCGIGAWRDVGALASAETSIFLAARSNDGTREPMLIMKDEMERKGLHVTWDEINGGHEPRERDELDTAFNWLNQMHG